MRFLSIAVTSLLTGRAVVYGALTEIMRSGTEVDPPAQRLHPDDAPLTSSNQHCQLRLSPKGNLIIDRKIDGLFTPAWHSGRPKDSNGDYILGDFFLAMQRDGNLVVYRESAAGGSDNEAVWFTGSTVWGYDMDYKLFLDNDTCALSVSSQRGTTSGGIIWFSLNTYWFGDDGNPLHHTLKKGMLYHPPIPEEHCDGNDCYDLTMYLQNDCNLLIFKGTDLADKGEVVWASNTADPYIEKCEVTADWGDGQIALMSQGATLWTSSGDWGLNYNVCLDESGPYPCDFDGEPLDIN